MQMAAKDPALSLNNNQGHPTVAATTHPAQLNGAGVVAAHPGTPVAAIDPQGHHVGGASATGNAPARQGGKPGPGNAPTIQGNHALPGVPGTAGAKGAPGANTATLPGNHTLPGVQSVHTPPPHAALTPPAPPPHAAAPPPPHAAAPPPPRVAAPAPPPRPPGPTAKPKCQPGQKC